MGNDKALGKWLLYLEELPIVEGTGGGECTVADRWINPLHLKIREQPASLMAPALIQDPALMKRPNRTHSFAEYREKSSSSISSSEKKSSNDETVLNRVRRDRSMIIRAEKLVDEDGKKTNIVSMVRSQSVIYSLSID